MLHLLLACDPPPPTTIVRDVPPDTGFTLDTRDDDGDGTVRSLDCDDEDPTRHLDAEEICGDGVDHDCDGMATECCADAPTPLEPRLTVRSGGLSGSLVGARARMGDVDGDGVAELLVAEPAGSEEGHAWLLGAAEGETTLADAARTTWEGTDWFGAAAAFLKRPDGGADVLVAAPGADSARGQVCRYDGTATGTVPSTDALGCWRGYGVDTGLGSQVDAPGDLDGDGVEDLLLVDTYGELSGVAWLVSTGAPYGGVDEVSFGSLQSDVYPTSDTGGARAVGVGDLDGDGVSDVLASWEVTLGNFVAHGPLSGPQLSGDLVALEHVGPVARTYGGGAAGDLDGDGHPEVWAIAEHGSMIPDAIAVWRGPALTTATPDALLVGEHVTLPPTGAASPGDLDGDGRDDLVVSAGRREDLTVEGLLYTLRGPPSGVVDLSCADARHAASDVLGFGGALAPGVDLDGDALTELIVLGISAEDGGTVQVFSPAQLW